MGIENRKRLARRGRNMLIAALGLATLAPTGVAAAAPEADPFAACASRRPVVRPSAEVRLTISDSEGPHLFRYRAHRDMGRWRVEAPYGECRRYRLSAKQGRALDRLVARPMLQAELNREDNAPEIPGCGDLHIEITDIEVRRRSGQFHVSVGTACRRTPITDEIHRLIVTSGRRLILQG